MESSFASRLREFRQHKKLSQEAFAEQCGLSQGNITQMERGRSEPVASNLIKVVAGFPDLNPDWLLLGSGEMLRNGRELTRLPADPPQHTPTAGPLSVVPDPEQVKDLKRRVRWLEEQVELWQRIATSGIDLSRVATGTDGVSFPEGNHGADELPFMKISYHWEESTSKAA